jgi:LCP family protein required for cell wall assembly
VRASAEQRALPAQLVFRVAAPARDIIAAQSFSTELINTMRVSPRSRRARRPRRTLIWIALMIACGVGSIFMVSLARDATRGFDAVSLAASDQRINVLLLGIDQREGLTDPARTDTMLVLTIDPQTKTAGMLSINRDLWVKIPGQTSEGKINTAHFLGEVEHVPGGGPALAQQTVQAALDIPLPYYIRLNFTAFEKLIDMIGGIDIEVAESIDDPTYPDAGFGYDPFYIEAGWQHLDGRTALKYARTRATAGSDLDRVKRQQQVILTVRDKILKNNQLANVLTQLGPLLQLPGGPVQTNLTPGQIIELINLAAQIDREQIHAVTLTGDMIDPYLALDGQEAIVLKPGVAQQLRAQLYASPITPNAPTANTAGSTAGRAVTPDLPTPDFPTLSAPTPSAPGVTVIRPSITVTPLLTTPTSTGGLQTHVVQPGDTLFSLARRYGVTVDEIVRANQIAGDSIFVGQQLIIPAAP